MYVDSRLGNLTLALVLIAATGCSPGRVSVVVPPAALDLQELRPNDEATFLETLRPLHTKMTYADFVKNYEGTLKGFVAIPDSPLEGSSIAVIRSKGYYCGYLLHPGGVSGPPELGTGGAGDAEKLVFFDSKSVPESQVSKPPWNRHAICDADGDPKTLELVRWSEECDGSKTPFLVIHRLSDLDGDPMLALLLNPEAGLRISEWKSTTTRSEDGTTVVSGHRVTKQPDRRGRWRFERNLSGRNDVVIEEILEGRPVEVARFHFNAGTLKWEGPAGGDDRFWKAGCHPWYQASFVRFAELADDRSFNGESYGELRRDVDQLKAARDAAREAGLK